MNILIIGGIYQGKLNFARSLPGFDEGAMADGESAGRDDFARASCINRLHKFVFRLLKEEDNPEEIRDFIRKNTSGKIIICDDICSGIVPLDKVEIRYRETTGRLLCELVKDADIVVRMQCGIAQLLKGTLPC